MTHFFAWLLGHVGHFIRATVPCVRSLYSLLEKHTHFGIGLNCIFDRGFQDCYSLRACASKEQNLLLYEGTVMNKMWSHFNQTYIAIYMIG